MKIKWFFEDAESVSKLRVAADGWKSPPTPFRKFSRVKGAAGGVDCIGLCEALMSETGVIGPNEFIFPRRAGDYSSAMAMPRVLRYLRGEIEDDPQSKELSRCFAEIRLGSRLSATSFLSGDIVVMRKASQFHVGVVVNGFDFLHVNPASGVSEGTMQDYSFKQYLVAVFRARAKRS